MDKLKFIIPLLAVLVLVGAGCGGGILDGGGDGAPEETVPILDVAGEDISDVPRYTGSVRIYYGPVPNTDIVVIEYLTSAGIDTVSDFYEAQLPANGWTSPTDEEMMKEFGLTYVFVGQGVEKGEYQTIVLVRDSSDYSGYTNINITFGPK
jgi:hypothetical protein